MATGLEISSSLTRYMYALAADQRTYMFTLESCTISPISPVLPPENRAKRRDQLMYAVAEQFKRTFVGKPEHLEQDRKGVSDLQFRQQKQGEERGILFPFTTVANS